MRTTVDLPGELYRHAKAEAALRGIKFKDLLADALRQALASPVPEEPIEKRPSLHDAMKDCCGIIKDAPSDYASNPRCLEDFGK